jgi:hypothetical protein
MIGVVRNSLMTGNAMQLPMAAFTKPSPKRSTMAVPDARGAAGRHGGMHAAQAASKTIAQGYRVNPFLQTLRTQRWDDHRYYHHDRINQSLHLLSAVSFVVAYVWLLIDPVVSALIGWLVSMTTRQAGHFFFEPHGYDAVNQATHAHKEEIKVGYNLRRKVVLMVLWAVCPLLVWLRPDLFGVVAPHASWMEFARHLGAIWLVLGVAGLLYRAIQLVLQHDLHTAVVWITKILTDPFHDIWLYHKAPMQLLRGERMDPMAHVHARGA